MVDKEKLIAAIDKSGKSKDAIAKEIGINRTTLYRKLGKNGDSFTIKEVQGLMRSIPLSKKEVHQIFLF